MSLKLVNTSTNEELKALKYAPPKKFTAAKAIINGTEVETRFTTGRDKSYTYFVVNNVSLYVPGALDPETNYTFDAPEGFGAAEAPADRVSTYKRKRPAKAEGADNAKSDASSESGAAQEAAGQESAGDAGGAPEGEGSVAGAEGSVAPRQRRKRGE
jgi:hypothetical protein